MNYTSALKCRKPYFLWLLMLSGAAIANTAIPKAPDSKQLSCGIDIGFPPFQFTENSRVAGFDADVTRLLMARLQRPFYFHQDQWDTVLNELRFNKIDLIVGMEITDVRKRIFDFSMPYYQRYDAIFVLEDNPKITQLDDLNDQFIAGDRHSYIESLWKQQGDFYRYRIISTQSKAQSMAQLNSGKVLAAIMPNAVGHYLANQLGIKVRIITHSDPGTPVAVAVKKGNQALLNQINGAIEQLQSEGEIARLYQQWFGKPLQQVSADPPTH